MVFKTISPICWAVLLYSYCNVLRRRLRFFPPMTLVFITQTLFLSISLACAVRRSAHIWSTQQCTTYGCYLSIFSSFWVSFPIVFEILDHSSLVWVFQEALPDQYCISDEFLERGGRVIFNTKIYVADFGNFKQGFLSMKLIQKE